MYCMFSGNQFLDRYKKEKNLIAPVCRRCSNRDILDDPAEQHKLGMPCQSRNRLFSDRSEYFKQRGIGNGRCLSGSGIGDSNISGRIYRFADSRNAFVGGILHDSADSLS